MLFLFASLLEWYGEGAVPPTDTFAVGFFTLHSSLFTLHSSLFTLLLINKQRIQQAQLIQLFYAAAAASLLFMLFMLFMLYELSRLSVLLELRSWEVKGS